MKTRPDGCQLVLVTPQPWSGWSLKLVIGEKRLGMPEAVDKVFPEAKCQRYTVHFYRNMFAIAPGSTAKMLKAIHTQENKKVTRDKARVVVKELHSTKLKEAAKKVEECIKKTLTYCDFPSEHWTCIQHQQCH